MTRLAILCAGLVGLMGCGSPTGPKEEPEFKVKYKACNADRTVCRDTVL